MVTFSFDSMVITLNTMSHSSGDQDKARHRIAAAGPGPEHRRLESSVGPGPNTLARGRITAGPWRLSRPGRHRPELSAGPPPQAHNVRSSSRRQGIAAEGPGPNAASPSCTSGRNRIAAGRQPMAAIEAMQTEGRVVVSLPDRHLRRNKSAGQQQPQPTRNSS
jgi:hypothetical protein